MHLVVTLMVGLELWAAESVPHVLAEVVAGWREVRGAPDGHVGATSVGGVPDQPANVAAAHHGGHRAGLPARGRAAVPGTVPGGGEADRLRADAGGVPGRAAPDGHRRHDAGHSRHAGECAPSAAQPPAGAHRCWGVSAGAGGGAHRDRHAHAVRYGPAPLLMEARRRPRATCCGRSGRARCCCGTAASIATVDPPDPGPRGPLPRPRQGRRHAADGTRAAGRLLLQHDLPLTHGPPPS